VHGFEAAHKDANVLVLGDFNARPDEAPIKVLTSGGLTDAFGAVRKKGDPLYITHESGRTLDYIFLNAGAGKELIAETRFILGTPARPAKSDYRVTQPPAGYGSDHYPVVIDLAAKDKD
jgi:endonuclease/exonuclease/phosphatase family metal-dependent hydrolase